MATRATSLFNGVPEIGDQIAAAGAVTATGSADLVSVATNTGGIIITSVSMNVSDTGSASNMALTVNGNTVLQVFGNPTASGFGPIGALGGFCAIKIPSGQAVAYTFTEGTTGSGYVRISWRAV